MKTAIRTGTVPQSWESVPHFLAPSDVAAKYVVQLMASGGHKTTWGRQSAAHSAHVYSSLPITTPVFTSTMMDLAAQLSGKPLARGVEESTAEVAIQKALDPEEVYIERIAEMSRAATRSADKVIAKIGTRSHAAIINNLFHSRLRATPARVEELLRRYILDNPHVILDKTVVGKQHIAVSAPPSQ